MAALNPIVDAIFGPSQAMRSVLEQVARAAASRGHLLISGEPGTGREMVAREIHRRGVQAHSGFVKIGCAPQREQDLELELFGYSTQGGSSSVERRTLESIARGGRLHEALAGTVFFEHLPELPARLQARLARLLRDREAVVVHERTPVNFNARAIASIEPGYDQAVLEGRVRADFHRLISTIRIELPPLRDRREDIPGLAVFFVEALCRQASVPAKSISQPAQQLLSALPWHGNALELRGLLQDLVHRVRGAVIQLDDVLAVIQLDGRTRPFWLSGTLREARSRFEGEYITAMLEQHRGRISEAAKALGIQRTNLYRKMRSLSVTRERRH